MNKEQNDRAPVERRVRRVCGNCKHIGEHGWGLPTDEKRCGKLKDRQADFDAASAAARYDFFDHFRFRPTDGVLPYSSAERCKHYEASLPSNAELTSLPLYGLSNSEEL